MITKVFHDVFNVANGKDNTVLYLVDALNKIIGNWALGTGNWGLKTSDW